MTQIVYMVPQKNVQRNERYVRFYKLASSFNGVRDDCQRDFWGEVKRLRGRRVCNPTTIDNVEGDKNIAELFSNKYKNLYNSVSYDVTQMNILKAKISDNITNHTCSQHSICKDDVSSSVNLLKQHKHDGNKGHFTNHIIHGTDLLNCYISLLFDSLISHGYVPKDFLLSTLVPIPKNKRKSLHC